MDISYSIILIHLMENRNVKKHQLRGPNLFIFNNNRIINLDHLLQELLMFFSIFVIIYSWCLLFFAFLYIVHLPEGPYAEH